MPATTATKIIDRLVTNNIAYRSLDRTDRRRVRLRLSPRGHGVHGTLASLIARNDEERFSELDPGQIIVSLTALLVALNCPASSVRRTVP